MDGRLEGLGDADAGKFCDGAGDPVAAADADGGGGGELVGEGVELEAGADGASGSAEPSASSISAASS